MKAKITRYPNNEIRIAVYPEKKRIDYFRDPTAADATLSSSLDSSDPSDPSLSNFSDGIGSNPTLDIKCKVDRVKRKLRYALSRYGRRQVLRSGSCFSTSPDTERLLLTGTLPGSTLKAFRTLAEYSTRATKLLTNWITYHEPSCKWIYCWEFQGRGALHLHLVGEFSSRSSLFVKTHFKDQWNKILRTICKESQVDLFAKTESYSHSPNKTQADVTVCDRQPSRYISKYISKNATNAHGFNRFPPKQWYQCSRSLLKALAEKTETFIVEGLDHRKALSFIEDSAHNLSQYTCSGWRRFEGSILAWSGYGFSDTFEITDWGKNFMEKGQNLSPTIIIAKHAVSVSKSYPQIRCWMRHVKVNEIETLMRTGTLSETELLMLIETVMQAIATSWSSLRNKRNAAMFMTRTLNWWESKFGGVPYTDSYRLEMNKICNESLTVKTVRTKVARHP